MAQTNILCPVTVPAFGLSEGASMYYTELANWIIAKNLEAMAAAGLQWSDNVPDDLESAWSDQTSSLNQQTAILTDLQGETETLSSGWLSRITAIKSQITNLLSLTQSAENYLARLSAVSLIEEIIATMAGLAKTQNPSDDETSDLLDVLKAAFLEEVTPGVYSSSTLAELQAILEAIQDLKYNEEILEIPATPRPLRIHLQAKTIQQ